jgi:hypothetical protein
MRAIAREINTEPETVKQAPHFTPVSRLNEVRAIKDANFRYRYSD